MKKRRGTAPEQLALPGRGARPRQRGTAHQERTVLLGPGQVFCLRETNSFRCFPRTYDLQYELNFIALLYASIPSGDVVEAVVHVSVHLRVTSVQKNASAAIVITDFGDILLIWRTFTNLMNVTDRPGLYLDFDSIYINTDSLRCLLADTKRFEFKLDL